MRWRRRSKSSQPAVCEPRTRVRNHGSAVQRVRARTSAAMRSAVQLPASVLLLAVAVGLPVVTFAAAYSVSDRVTEGEIWRRKGYFLSAAIDTPPASNFGSLGLTVALMAFVGVTIVRHHIVAERLRVQGTRPALRSLHSISLAAALVSGLGGHGVAAFPHHADRRWHNSFAAVFVLCALTHFALESTLERRAMLSSYFARGFRLALVLTAAVNCVTFISHVMVEEMWRIDIGIGKLPAALAEITTCICFVLYLASYWRSLNETRITLSVTYSPVVAHICEPHVARGSSPASHGQDANDLVLELQETS